MWCCTESQVLELIIIIIIFCEHIWSIRHCWHNFMQYYNQQYQADIGI